MQAGWFLVELLDRARPPPWTDQIDLGFLAALAYWPASIWQSPVHARFSVILAFFHSGLSKINAFVTRV